MAYITDRLVSSCARSSVTFDIGLHEICVQVRVRYVITQFFLGWIVYQILLPMVLGCASSATKLIKPTFCQCQEIPYF